MSIKNRELTTKNRPSKPAIIVPLSFIVLNAILFTSILGCSLTLQTGILIHFLSFIILGVAFEIPELSLNVWCLRASAHPSVFNRSFERVKKALAIRYILTHFIAPASGITVMASGLFLVHKGGYSFATGWLFWVMVTATIGLYKGMYQHNLFIRRLRASTENTNPTSHEPLRRALRSPVDQFLIFLEFPTYVFNYAAAYYKFPLANPLAGQIHRIDMAGMNVTAGFVIIICGSLLLPVLRALIRRFSRTQLLLDA